MRIGMLGTGMVGKTIASALIGAGHEVTMGSRSATSPAAAEWVAATGAGASHGTFADAAAGAELVVNCTSGEGSLPAIAAAGAANLAGKTLVDVSNPLDFSQGFPPSMTVCNTESLAEQIQQACPEARVVKALNTMGAAVMVDPARLPGPHAVPICGDDAGAKAQTAALLGELGWPAESILDLGDLAAARGMEMYVMFWLRVFGALGTPDFNIRIVRAG